MKSVNTFKYAHDDKSSDVLLQPVGSEKSYENQYELVAIVIRKRIRPTVSKPSLCFWSRTPVFMRKNDKEEWNLHAGDLFSIESNFTRQIAKWRIKKKTKDSRHQLDDSGKPETICLYRQTQEEKEH
jgi:hypothetical protein